MDRKREDTLVPILYAEVLCKAGDGKLSWLIRTASLADIMSTSTAETNNGPVRLLILEHDREEVFRCQVNSLDVDLPVHPPVLRIRVHNGGHG